MIFPLRISAPACPFCGAFDARSHLATCRLAGRRLRLSSALRLAEAPVVDALVRKTFAGLVSR